MNRFYHSQDKGYLPLCGSVIKIITLQKISPLPVIPLMIAGLEPENTSDYYFQNNDRPKYDGAILPSDTASMYIKQASSNNLQYNIEEQKSTKHLRCIHGYLLYESDYTFRKG